MPVTTPSFLYPTRLELEAIDQILLPVLQNTNPIFREFPVREIDAVKVAWEQRNSYLGLMQARGQEAEYPTIRPVGYQRYEMVPGYYGESAWIYGKEIEERRGFGTINGPIDVRDLVTERLEQTATRQYNLMAYILWQLVATGYYVTVGPTGAIVVREKIVVQKRDAAVNWSSASTATPLKDFRLLKLLHRGASVMFDGSAEAWMNTTTLNDMLANTNADDIGGRRADGLSTIQGLAQLNELVMKDNSPKIVEYDEGYLDASGNFQLFIPDNTVVVFGKRSNKAALGDFCLTRNADNNNASTPLVKVVEVGIRDNDPPPAKIGVYRGFNGGPRVFYPGAILVMNTKPT
jgi:hypothetical protein